MRFLLEGSEDECEVLEEDELGGNIPLRDPVDVAGFCADQEVPTQKSQFGPLIVSEVHMRVRELLGSSGSICWNHSCKTTNGFSDAFLRVCTGGPLRDLDTLCFVVLEVCGGAGGISQACGKRNIRCGPVIEIKNGLDFLDEALFYLAPSIIPGWTYLVSCA